VNKADRLERLDQFIEEFASEIARRAFGKLTDEVSEEVLDRLRTSRAEKKPPRKNGFGGHFFKEGPCKWTDDEPIYWINPDQIRRAKRENKERGANRGRFFGWVRGHAGWLMGGMYKWGPWNEDQIHAFYKANIRIREIKAYKGGWASFIGSMRQHYITEIDHQEYRDIVTQCERRREEEYR
jgi:hypothetical protein